MIAAFVGGLLLGGLFFIGLWWTIRRALPSPHPARWFLLSLLLRSSVTTVGLYLLCGNDWQRWLSAVTAFVLMRWLTSRHFTSYGAIAHDTQP